MIISASRRTDIPSYYADWFFNRTKEGFVLARNPVNFRQISRISLAPEAVDGIVFWTKNPSPMLGRLGEIEEYRYYFQFTLTPYGKDIEPDIPGKPDIIIPAFKRLSKTIGADRVIWRYDPILISEKYSAAYHVRAFKKLAEELHGHTRKVTVSFIDVNYRGLKSNTKELALQEFPPTIQIELASRLSEIARSYGLAIDTCAEKIDLRPYGIEHARCIDDKLLGKLFGRNLNVGKDKNQRLECGCVSSVDIGMYNTCLNGCRYCYANYNKAAVGGNFARHNPVSPLISGEVGEGDSIIVRECTTRPRARLSSRKN
ncbi:MAG: DUF1848 domain-containing protein [Clostridiales bacterium]|jgi:hypothetical protein|nr:DUF1848 domain-containing protein [Clostridiales bacterium]